jgi:hypothetical protein
MVPVAAVVVVVEAVMTLAAAVLGLLTKGITVEVVVKTLEVVGAVQVH